MGLRAFLRVLAFMRSGTELMDCSTSVKLRAYEVASVVGTKLFCAHGSINIAMKTYGLQYRQFLTLENPALLLELEAIILRAAEPPYNVQIPTEM